MKKLCGWMVMVLWSVCLYAPALPSGMHFETVQEEAGVFQGTIKDIQGSDLLIEKLNGEVVTVSLPGEIAEGVNRFRLEEVVEITMTSGGIVTSVVPVPGEVQP